MSDSSVTNFKWKNKIIWSGKKRLKGGEKHLWKELLYLQLHVEFVWFQLLSLCEADDSQLLKLPCYKTVQSLTPLRKSALSKCPCISWKYWTGNRMIWLIDFSYWPSELIFLCHEIVHIYMTSTFFVNIAWFHDEAIFCLLTVLSYLFT